MGSESFDIDVSLRASQYITGGDKLVSKNKEIEESFIEAVTSVERFEKTLDGNVIKKIFTTVKEVDSLGRKIATTFEGVGNQAKAVGQRVGETLGELKALNREADRIRDIGTQKLQGRTRESSGVDFSDPAFSSTEEDRFDRAERQFLKLGSTGKATFLELEAALDKARAGTIRKLTADGDAERAAVQLVRAEEALGRAYEVTQEKQRKSFEKEIALNDRRIAKTNEILEAQLRLDASQRLKTDVRKTSPVDFTDQRIGNVEADQFLRAEQGFIKLAETGKASIVELQVALDRARDGSLKKIEADTLAEKAAVNLALAENKVTAAIKKTEEIRKKSITTSLEAVKKQAAGIQKILDADKRLQESQRLRQRSRATSGADLASADITDQEANKFLAAEKQFLSLAETGKSSIRQLEVALDAARAGTVSKLTADNEATQAAIVLAAAEKDLGNQYTKTQDKAKAAQQQEEITSKKRRALVVESVLAQESVQALGASKKTSASDPEKASFSNAEAALVRLAETGKATGAEIQDALRRAQGGLIKFGEEANETDAKALRLVTTFNKLGTKKLAARTAELKRGAEQLDKNNKLAKEQARIQLEIENIRKASRAGIDLGKGTEAQVQGFLKAEQALIKLAATGKITGAQLEAALLEARGGTLSYITATTDAQKATLKLAAAQDQVGKAAGPGGGGPLGKFFASAVDLVKVTGIGLFIGNIFRLQGAMEEAITDAAELSRKLAEIDTIQTQNALTTEQWGSALRQLSNDFGISTLDQAEAAYQALSNQVAQGTQAVKFLGAANRLAVTGITDASSAVNLLTSAINAFHLPVEEADTLSAKFFKTVELGRLRIEDLSDIFGRVAVPANQLGITVDEVNAAVATLSIQGIKADESLTLLRNIIQKIIRPGDKLQATFEKLGFASGQAAIDTLGFGGVLAALEKEVGGNVEEVGELFQRIRAVSGVLGFAGKQAQVYANNLEAIRGADVNEFLEDTNKVLNSTGQTLKRASEQAKNFFEESFGTPALEVMAKTIESMGGAENAIQNTIDVLQVLASAAAIGGVVVVGQKMLTVINGLTTAQVALGATTAATNKIAAVNPYIAIAVAIAAVSEGINQLAESELRTLEKEAGKVGKRFIEIEELAARMARKRSQAIVDAVDEIGDASKKSVAERRAALEVLSQSAAKNAKLITARFKAANREITSSIKATIKEQDTLYKNSTKSAKKAADEIEKIFNAIDLESLNADISIGGLGLQSKFLEQEIVQAKQKAQAAASRGDIKVFQEETKRAQSLGKRKLETEIKLSKERAKLREKELGIERKLRTERSSKARASLQQDLRDLRERVNVIRNGTKTQLAGLEELQTARRKVQDAGSSSEQRDAQKELQEIEKRQARINAEVDKERRLREQLIQQQKDQAIQLQAILVLNAKQAAASEKRKANLESTRFLLSLVSEEAKTFSESQALGGKSAEAINKSVAEQQQRFARILALQEKLSVDPSGQDAIRERSTGLQERTQIALNKLQEDQNRKDIKAIQDRFKEQVTSLRELTVEDNKRVANLRKNLVDAGKTFTKFFTFDEALPKEEEIIRIGQRASEAFGLSQRGDQALRQSLADPSGQGGPFGDFGRQILDLTVAMSELNSGLEAQAAPGREFTTDDAARNKVLQEQISGLAKGLIEEASKTPVTPQNKEAFQALFDLTSATRLGVASAESLSKAQNTLLKGVEAQNKLLGTNLRLEALNTTGKKKVISSQAAQVKAIEEAQKSIDDLKEAATRGTGKVTTAAGLPEIPGVDTNAKTIEDAFDKGGKSFSSSLAEEFQKIFNNLKKGLAEGGAEAGKNQANALVDQTKARADQAKRELEAAAAARKKAIEDARKLRGRGEVIDSGGQRVVRGGGPAAGEAGFGADGGLVFREQAFADTTQGRKLEEALAKQAEVNKNLLEFRKQQAAKGGLEGTLPGQADAEKALRDFLAKRGPGSFDLSGAAPGQDVAEIETLRAQFANLADQQADKLLPQEAGPAVALLDRIAKAQEAEAAAREKFKLDTIKSEEAATQGLVGQPANPAAIMAAITEQKDALSELARLNIGDAPKLADNFGVELSTNSNILTENNRIIAKHSSDLAKLASALSPEQFATFTPQLTPTVKGNVDTQNNTTNNNDNRRITINLSNVKDPKTTAAEIQKILNRNARLQGSK